MSIHKFREINEFYDNYKFSYHKLEIDLYPELDKVY